MRVVSMMAFAGAWLLLPACGAVAIDDGGSCGADTCGTCPTGQENRHACGADGKWTCSCNPPQVGQCTMAPTCRPGEKRMPDQASCDRMSSAQCRVQTTCGTTILCASPARPELECDGMPQCDPSDTRLTSQADCPPGSGCYSREACGSTVWCASGPAVDPIWPPTATKLVAVNEGGGFVANPPPGSPCAIDGAKFTFTPSTRHLAWELCNSTATPYAIVKGQRTITVGEAGTIDAAMSKLVIVNTNTCGADKPSLWVSVTTPSATAKYLDSFYACNKQGSYVDEIDGVFSVLRPLAK